MSWREAFTTLAGVSVAGVAGSRDLDALPKQPCSADLPLLVPDFALKRRSLGGNTEAFSALTYEGGRWRAEMVFDHLLLWRPCLAGGGLSAALPGLMTAVDAYLEAVGADPDMDGALSEPLAIIRIEPGVLDYGGVSYHGVRFRHRWIRALTPGVS